MTTARKMAFLTFTIFLLATVHLSLQSRTSDKFSSDRIIDDLAISAPDDQCEVSYGSTVVDLGNELSESSTSQQPSVKWTTHDSSLYTILFVDPDAPSRTNPIRRSWRHWVVVNVPGTDVSRGDTLTSYRGPSPPSGSGLHRYVLLILKQDGQIDRNEDLGDRGSFNVHEYISKHNLKLIAGNYFQVKNE